MAQRRRLTEYIRPLLLVEHSVFISSTALDLCSYRVRGVDGSCAKHLTAESYTVVMLLTFIIIIIIVFHHPSVLHSRLKPYFSANPSHRSLFFLLQD